MRKIKIERRLTGRCAQGWLAIGIRHKAHHCRRELAIMGKQKTQDRMGYSELLTIVRKIETCSPRMFFRRKIICQLL